MFPLMLMLISLILHFHIIHNALCLPPKTFHEHCFQFLLGKKSSCTGVGLKKAVLHTSVTSCAPKVGSRTLCGNEIVTRSLQQSLCSRVSQPKEELMTLI